MCGIVAAVAGTNIVRVLVEGLKKLEYRGYDSASLAIIGAGAIERVRSVGRVAQLEAASAGTQPVTGIAHTRWATQGVPCERNAHPHISGAIAVVHNGIIQDYESLDSYRIGSACGYHSRSDDSSIMLDRTCSATIASFNLRFTIVPFTKSRRIGSNTVT